MKQIMAHDAPLALRIEIAMQATATALMGQSLMFTAYDVSRVLQAYGVRERHDNMRAAVHTLYGQGGMRGYERTSQDVGGERGPAWVYHPMGTDPKLYRSFHDADIAQVVQLLPPVPKAIPAAGDADVLEAVFEVEL